MMITQLQYLRNAEKVDDLEVEAKNAMARGDKPACKRILLRMKTHLAKMEKELTQPDQ